MVENTQNLNSEPKKCKSCHIKQVFICFLDSMEQMSFSHSNEALIVKTRLKALPTARVPTIFELSTPKLTKIT